MYQRIIIIFFFEQFISITKLIGVFTLFLFTIYFSLNVLAIHLITIKYINNNELQIKII